MSVSKNWCFTWNNPPADIREVLAPHVTYAVWQEEKGKEETRHFQGYVELDKKSRLSALKKISKEAHWEARKSSRLAARNYCMKTDTRVSGPYEIGEWTGPTGNQGQRTDLMLYRQAIKRGATDADLCDDHFAMVAKYPRLANHVRSAYCVQPSKKPRQVVLLVGPPRTGKTHWCRTNFYPEPYTIPICRSGLWFNGYVGQDNVIIDDFAGRASKVPLVELLRYLHDWPEQVEIKGGFTWFNPSIVFITSNLHPKLWYEYGDRQIHYDALCARMTTVIVDGLVVDPRIYFSAAPLAPIQQRVTGMGPWGERFSG